MKIQRWCNVTELNWPALPDLKSRVERLGVAVKMEEVTLNYAPDTVTHDSFQRAADAVRQQGAPRHYSLHIWGNRDGKIFRLQFNRSRNLRNQEVLLISADGIEDSKTLDTLTEFLGLFPMAALQAPPVLPKSGFIAHRFDEHGNDCAERIVRFLELLGFSIVTGRTYSPRSIAEKVRGRIAAQELLFVVLTPGAGDDTWLTQEPIAGESKDKPLFLLKEEGFDYKSGLLGDREYIPFPPDCVEVTFIPILEGLRDLGYDTGR